MNTVEELRKAFARGHVLKGVDWIFDLAKALEERVERIELANIANAGIRLKEQEFLATVKERLEALERDHSIERQAHRIDALEARLEATLSTLKGNGIRGDNPLYADRAHGPLEAKAELPELDAPDGPNWPFGMTKPEDIGEFMNGVGAVLKALDSMVRTFADRGSDYWLKDLEECERQARAALKPFEVKP